MREPLLRMIGGGAALLSLVATAWFAWAYAGPYAWLAELQLASMGSYSVQLTFLGTLLLCLAPAAAVVLPIRLALGAEPHEGRSGLDAAHWLGQRRGLLVALTIAATGLGGGTFFALDAVSIGERTEVSLASIEAGDAPPSRWVVLHGAPRFDLALSSSEGSTTTHYVPLVATTPARPAVFLELSDYARNDVEIASGTYEGVLDENGLPGLVRAELERAGAIGERHYTLDWRGTPSGRWTKATVFAVVGVVGLVVALGLWLFERARGPR